MNKNLLFLLAFAANSLFAQGVVESVTSNDEQYNRRAESCQNGNIAECMPIYAKTFVGIPYVAKTLEINPTEELVLNFSELDCTTFVETVLAMAITANSDGDRSIEGYKTTLQKLRYHQGNIDGYASRIHYFSDWLYENEANGFIRNITQELGGVVYSKEINFMSTHPKSYDQLRNGAELDKIKAIETNMNQRKMFYIPKEEIRNVEDKLNDGDIIAITTSVEGLDVAHEGMIMKRDGRAYFVHASSEAKKVVYGEETISDYVLRHKSQTGIMVARPN